MRTSSPQETGAIAEMILRGIAKGEYYPTLALSGDLGAGKTTFTQAFAKALGIRKRILSPTFLIMKRFPIHHRKFKNMYHIDAYRVSSADLEKLGVREIFNGENIVLIEWADRVRDILPKTTTWIKFSHGTSENERKITIN